MSSHLRDRASSLHPGDVDRLELQRVAARRLAVRTGWRPGGRVGGPLDSGQDSAHTEHANSPAFSATYADFLHRNAKLETRKFYKNAGLKSRPTGRNLQLAPSKDNRK